MTGIGDECPFIVACAVLGNMFVGVLSVIQLGGWPFLYRTMYSADSSVRPMFLASSVLELWRLLSFHHRASTSLRSCPYRCRMRR